MYNLFLSGFRAKIYKPLYLQSFTGKNIIVYFVLYVLPPLTTTKFNKNTYSADSHILFNENSIIETLDDKPLRFDQELQFTHKFSNQEVLILQGRFIQEEFIQNYNSNTFLFNELFNDESLDSIHEKSENKGKLWGISAKYLNRKSNGNLLSLNLTNTYTQWDWANHLSENENSFSAINFNNHNENNTILNAKYLYKFSEKFYVHPEIGRASCREKV